MAPSVRGRGSARGTQSFRAGGRGGRGRGRGNAKGYGQNRSTFISTRVEEPFRDDSDGTRESPEPGGESQEQLSEDSLSDSGDEIVANASINSYSILLQSLNAKNEQGQPQRKKRKIEDKEHLREEIELEQDLDFVEELEEAEHPEFANTGDADEVDDVEDSELLQVYMRTPSHTIR